jgi:hypothetical protein
MWSLNLAKGGLSSVVKALWYKLAGPISYHSGGRLFLRESKKNAKGPLDNEIVKTVSSNSPM